MRACPRPMKDRRPRRRRGKARTRITCPSGRWISRLARKTTTRRTIREDKKNINILYMTLIMQCYHCVMLK